MSNIFPCTEQALGGNSFGKLYENKNPLAVAKVSLSLTFECHSPTIPGNSISVEFGNEKEKKSYVRYRGGSGGIACQVFIHRIFLLVKSDNKVTMAQVHECHFPFIKVT